jgi:hypothetical protein
MSGSRTSRAAVTGIRIAAGAVASAAVVVAVMGGIAFGWPTRTATPVTVSATPIPADTVLACDGPLLALGRQADNAQQVSQAAAAHLVIGTGAGTTSPTRSSLASPDVTGSDGPTVLTAPPNGRSGAVVGASGSATVKADDLAGFAASACRPALLQQWLVGGATTTGSADLVLLSNPGTVAATVQLTVFGADGPQSPPGGADIVIPAGTQRVIPLAGLILGEESPVVRVTASGAPVQAALQSSITRTLTPGGVDQVSAIPTAETTEVIPGVRVTSAPSGEATTIVRMLAPAATTATVTVTTADGAPGASRTVPLGAGAPTEVEMPGLAVGTYTVTVSATSPLVAAVWQATGVDAGSDFAWVAAAPTLTAATPVAVPNGPSPVLTVANPGTTPATVTLTPLTGGAAQKLSIPAGRTVSATVGAGSTYSLDPGGASVHAAVSFGGTGAVAAFPVWPGGAAGAGIVVHP